MCCRRRSPVDKDRTSYFFVSRAERVPLPAPGLPNMSMRSTLRSPWSGAGFCTLATLFKEKARALDAAVDDWKARRDGAHTTFGRREALRRPDRDMRLRLGQAGRIKVPWGRRWSVFLSKCCDGPERVDLGYVRRMQAQSRSRTDCATVGISPASTSALVRVTQGPPRVYLRCRWREGKSADDEQPQPPQRLVCTPPATSPALAVTRWLRPTSTPRPRSAPLLVCCCTPTVPVRYQFKSPGDSDDARAIRMGSEQLVPPAM